MAPYQDLRSTQSDLSDSDGGYDESRTKLLDAETWDDYPYRGSRRWTAKLPRGLSISLCLNVILLCSLITMIVLASKFMQFPRLQDPLHNEIIRQTSEHCESMPG